MYVCVVVVVVVACCDTVESNTTEKRGHAQRLSQHLDTCVTHSAASSKGCQHCPRVSTGISSCCDTNLERVDVVRTTLFKQFINPLHLRRHELLLEMPSHHGEVWCCAVASGGDLLLTAGHDRSLRRFERTSEPFFVEEEREKRLESLFEADLEGGPGGGGDPAAEGADDGGGSAAAARRTLEGAGSADALVDALEVAAAELERRTAHDASKGPLPANPIMLGLNPSDYVLKAVSARISECVHCLACRALLKVLGWFIPLQVMRTSRSWCRCG
jgi:hypothetical protein